MSYALCHPYYVLRMMLWGGTLVARLLPPSPSTRIFYTEVIRITSSLLCPTYYVILLTPSCSTMIFSTEVILITSYVLRPTDDVMGAHPGGALAPPVLLLHHDLLHRGLRADVHAELSDDAKERVAHLHHKDM
eukprot:8079523-Pyramimonas_sp.AAC.2